jgi:hypothetical protein
MDRIEYDNKLDIEKSAGHRWDYFWSSIATSVSVTNETYCCDFYIVSLDTRKANKRGLFIGIAGM